MTIEITEIEYLIPYKFFLLNEIHNLSGPTTTQLTLHRLPYDYKLAVSVIHTRWDQEVFR